MNLAGSNFEAAAAVPNPQTASSHVREAIDTLFHEIDVLLENADVNHVEPQMCGLFKKFLANSGFHFANKNFDALLKEKSGKHFRRNNGKINWYHEFTPIYTMLAIIRLGREKGGLDLEDFDAYGGLETYVIKHLRHDSTEDHTTKNQLRLDLLDMLYEIEDEGLPYDLEYGERKLIYVMTGNDLISQQKLLDGMGRVIRDEKGKALKEEFSNYMGRLVHAPETTPLDFILKEGDTNHNFGSIFAPKFDATRRLERCNTRENMFGRTCNFSSWAIRRWPDFASAIKILDDRMGQLIFTQFGYLENVDRVYLNMPKAFQRDGNNQPLTIAYIDGALKLKLNPQLDDIHVAMKDMMKSVDPATEPEKYERLINFFEKRVKPSLAGFESHFPYIFGDHPPSATAPAPAPVAM